MCIPYHKKAGTVPPCDECLPPLMSANRDAVRVWVAVQGQVITIVEGSSGGMGQMAMGSRAIDLNHDAIHKAMGLYKVADKVGCFEKVLSLGREFITNQQ